MARHWVTAVLPRVRVRQWVLSLPFGLRVPLAYHRDLALAVHTVMMRVIEGWYRTQGKALGIEDGRTGCITVVQRFGSDLALNVHFHVLGLDGVYDLAGHFTAIAAPSIEQMEKLCTIAERVQRLLLRRAIEHDEPEEQALAISLSRSAARLGTEKHAPKGTDPEHDHDATWKRKARVAGFDLEATTEVRPDDRERLEHLCCYLLRPPLAERRLRLLPGGTVAQEPLARRHHLALHERAHVFGEAVLPRTEITHQPNPLPRRTRCKLLPQRDGGARARRLRPPQERHLLRADALSPVRGLTPRTDGLGLDVLACSCGKRMRYLATIFDRKELQRLLTAKGLPHRIEPISLARGPPPQHLDFGA